MTSQLRNVVARVLITALTGLAAPLPTQADPGRADPRLEARARLIGHGVDPAAADARVAALTDEEAARLAATSDSVPAGGGLHFIALILTLAVVWELLPIIAAKEAKRSERR